ncbi:unnamed protein product, partial [Effrenium voratum]
GEGLSSGWRQVAGSEVYVPSRRPRRRIHFLGGAFVGASPRLFYETFLETMGDECEAIVIATPYTLSFDYDSMAALSAASLESVSRSLAADLPDSVDLPLVAVGHSCGALLHSLLAAEGSYEGQACVLMSFNNKPVSDAIPVPLPPRLEDSRLRGLVSRNLEAALANGNVEETLNAARALLQVAGVEGDTDLARKAAPVVSQFGPLLGGVVEGDRDFSLSRSEVSERVSSISTRTLVVRFANDFTDESERLKDILQEAGQQVQLLRFPGGHTAPLDSSDTRLARLCANIAAFADQEPAGQEGQKRNLSSLKDRFLRLSAGCNRGFSPLPADQRANILECIEELEALNPDVNAGTPVECAEAVSAKLAGKWRLVWATSPDVLLLSSLPLAECGEIRQDISLARARDLEGVQIKAVNSVELSPKGAGLLGAALPQVARAVTVVAKVQASGNVFADGSFGIQFEDAKLEPLAEGFELPSLPLLLPSVGLSSSLGSIKLLTTYLDNELRIARSSLGDVFMFSKTL